MTAIEDAGELLKEKIDSSVIPAPEGTTVNLVAGEIMEMALAYLSDGGSFAGSGDRVNALASYAYGLGWLDAGIYLGFIIYSGNKDFLSLNCDDEIPESLTDHLEEKTGRYRRMLNSARGAVIPAPDAESPAFHAAVEISEEGDKNLKTGIIMMDDEKILSSALWHFSYGYGWLDAGVRSGILSITGDRSLFTV